MGTHKLSLLMVLSKQELDALFNVPIRKRR